MTAKSFDLLLLLVVVFVSVASAFVTRQQQQQQQQLVRTVEDDSGFSPLFAIPSEDGKNHPNRRAILRQTTTTAVATAIWLASTTTITTPDAAAAAYAKASSISPEEAYQRLLGAREELLTAAKENVSKRDVKGMKQLLVTNRNANVNRMDASMQVLLESKALDAESKKAIGTIRTYGVGADVMIMYGGLRGEFLPPGGIVEEVLGDGDDDDDDDDDDDGDTLKPNWGEVQKYLFRTLDSLQEVIVICRSNGFENGKKK
jgi:hypothetical protein